MDGAGCEEGRVGRILRRYGLEPGTRWWSGRGWEAAEEWRERAKSDLYFLSTVVLGCSRFGTLPMPGPYGERGLSCNEEMCELLNGDWGGKTRALFLEPRGHFKSTILRNYCIQRVLRDPSTTILLMGATLQNQAMRSLVSLKKQFEDNQVLRALFPEIRPMRGRWTGRQITVTRPTHRDEATVEVIGFGGEPEGGHYDLIVIDDPVTHENSKTPERQRLLIAWIAGIEPMLNPEGRIVAAGTRYADYDWYGFVEREASSLWNITVRPAVYDDAGAPSLDIANAHILFEEEWSRERLQEKLVSIGHSAFSCQYLNDPVPASIAEINHEALHSAFCSVPDDLEATYYCALDPATEKGSDEAAVATVGIDSQKVLWVIDVRGGLWDVRENLRQLWESIEEYKPQHSIIEAIGVGAALEQMMMEEMDARGYYPSVEYIKSWEKNLHQMVRTVLIPRLECGKVKIASHLKSTPLLEQLLRFPKSRRDDRLAAMTMAVWTAVQYGHSRVEEPERTEPVTERDDSLRSEHRGPVYAW